MTEPSSDDAVISARHVWREFGGVYALRDVSVTVQAGEIHALLGPNGAGKTTLLRILTGLIEPSRGSIAVAGILPKPGRSDGPSPLGLVPASDRSFYLRISGFENLLFFARLHGHGYRAARERALDSLERVGLASAAHKRAYEYSHGMLKRLGVARALLADPPALLVDEATHDLDPDGARMIRDLIREIADGGTAMIWTTQRIEEIQGLADSVSVLVQGEIRFTGSVDELVARSPRPAYIVSVHNGGASGDRLLGLVRDAVRGHAAVAPAAAAADGLFRVELAADVVLGEVFAAMTSSELTILGCREERPKIEEAFLTVTREAEA